ncbi:hypothetical protein GOP47_0023661 [Adiantum capillus-veneris]|uniref:Rab-GAP TBC domain-containing protein n=1 Tax=Adiantum capillus-veneris TaxID=13818 RepID=A0A9D4U6G5_ADICA|nr:hypothetical protein GOP47_0023661 [Adiantum capillus-veneris]
MPPSSHASDFDSESPRFSDASVSGSDWPAEPRLRGLRWRVMLGVLPICPTTIESLRRAAANGRRRYAELRRGLIVDPHSSEDGQKGENLSVNNPLSQDPDSIWGRYFRNAELEKIIESDLTRLYPEHGSFFQSYGCQAMLRRILLVWVLVHPQYGYRQGMHEVLAPLVYVLHLDVTHLSQVRQRYQDPFEDRFDTPNEDRFSFCKEAKPAAPSLLPRSALHVSSEDMFIGDEDWLRRVHPDDLPLVEADDFGFNLETMVLGSDSYGAEGELGALLSGRFVEHDAYCMFDSLLRGQGAAVVLADYFSAVNDGGTGLSPVLEASADIYHSLAAVDMSLYLHLVGLGVEPQFFALRWLRVLFGREFDLEKLLLLWDAILGASNSGKESEHLSGARRSSARGSFITNFAVSMILYLRSNLLASSNATTCLQKLLNFPKNVDIRNLIENAKRLQTHSEELLKTTPSPGSKHSWLSEQRSRNSKLKSFSRSPSFQTQIFSPLKVLQQRFSGSPEMIRPPVPESYWEERWMNSVFPKEQPQTVDAAGDGSDVPNVPRSVSAPEDVLVNSSLGGTGRVEGNHIIEASHSDSAKLVTTSGDLVSGPSDIEVNTNNFVTEASSTEANSNGDVCCTKMSETASTGPACNTLERDTGREDSGERVCIHALDLSTGTSMNGPSSCRPGGAACLCNSCNEGSQEGLQRSRRRHSASELLLPTNEDSIDDGQVNEGSFMKGVSKAFMGRHSRSSLQALGRAMVESIQVLENVLPSICKEGGASKALGESIQETSLENAKGQLTAVTALTDLRKISNILLQM